MISFRGIAFCTSSVKQCGNTECDRYFKDSDKQEAVEWGGENAPVAWGSFGNDCGKFIKKEQEIG